MPSVGEVIAGKYRVERPIGAGGMGTVVAATHVQLGTPVALKFLSDKIKDSAGSIERFTREARASAGLRGEHVCRVSDFGLHDGMPYIAMELLDGIDLAQLIANSAVATGLAVELILQACSGLAEAHGRGIVHRDLKPGNLFLTRRPDGTPLIKVLDFGVAKVPQADDASLTKTSSVIGSPGYMAPEQLRSSKTVDTRADIWALGVILYELISKRHPFAAQAVTEIALKIAMDEPDPLVEAPDGLRAVVMRCLEKEPDGRFPDVASLVAALEPFAVRDRAAAIAAAKLWIEAPWSRPLLPTTMPTAAPKASGYDATQVAASASYEATQASAHAATLAATSSGREATQRPSSTVSPAPALPIGDPPKRGRAIAIAVVAVLAIGGVVAFAMTRGGGDTTVDASVVATTPDAAATTPPTPDANAIATADAAASLSEDAAVVAVVVDAGTPRIRPPGPGSAKKPPGPGSPKPPGPGSAKPPGPGSAKPPGPGSAAVKPDNAGSGSDAPPPVVDKVEAERAIARVNNTMNVRGLRSDDDLGEKAQKLKSDLVAARKAKDWVAVKDAATQLVAALNGFIVDRAFIEKKSARLTAQIAAHPPGDEMKKQLLKLQTDADDMGKSGNFLGANLSLNQAFMRLPIYQPPGIPNY